MPSHIGREKIATAGGQLDDLTAVVAERGADFTNALEQAVFADINLRPDRLHQFLLGEDAAGIVDEILQHLECLRTELEHAAIRAAQLGPLPIQFKPVKTKNHNSRPRAPDRRSGHA